jgi:hypothetical protein
MFTAYAVWKNIPQEVATAKFVLIIRPEKQFFFALSASNCVLLKLLYTNIQFKSRLNYFKMAEKSSFILILTISLVI